jgi:hypothetical protein
MSKAIPTLHTSPELLLALHFVPALLRLVLTLEGRPRVKDFLTRWGQAAHFESGRKADSPT